MRSWEQFSNRYVRSAFLVMISTAPRFYRDVLELTEKSVAANWAVFDVAGQDLVLEVVTHDDAERALAGRLLAVSFAVDDIDDVYRNLVAKGISFRGHRSCNPGAGYWLFPATPTETFSRWLAGGHRDSRRHQQCPERGHEGEGRATRIDLAPRQFDPQECRHRGPRAGQGASRRRRSAGPVAEDDQAAPGIGRSLRKGRSRRASAAGTRRDRYHCGLPAETDVRGRGQGRHRGGDPGDRRGRHEGYGQSDRRAEGQICGQNGFRQGVGAGEGGTVGVKPT